jgi:RHS repeat-associated protein
MENGSGDPHPSTRVPVTVVTVTGTLTGTHILISRIAVKGAGLEDNNEIFDSDCFNCFDWMFGATRGDLKKPALKNGSSANDVRAEFIWMSPQVGDSGMFGGDDGLGGYMPLAVAVPTATAGITQLSWVHANHMGVPIRYSDASGITVNPTGDYSVPGFPGQSQTTTDLYYNKYRDYDPTTGRYIQADPIGLAGGASPYSYAMNNPLRYSDPEGEFVPLVILGGIAIGAGSELAIQAGMNWWNGRDVFNASCYEWGEVAIAGGMGAFGGAWAKSAVRLTTGSMKWNNVSRRIRRAEDMIGNPNEQLHHWAITQQMAKKFGLPDGIVNRPWNLNRVPTDLHIKWHNMDPIMRTILGAPRPVQAAGALGVAGAAGEMADGGWE